MYVENNAKNIPLLKIVFLELKKYNENLKMIIRKLDGWNFLETNTTLINLMTYLSKLIIY